MKIERMGPSLSPAKITRPESSGAVRRLRLFRMLDQSLLETVIWMSGPPGAGKTTLASNWIEERRIPSLWYQMDKGDSDPAGFFYYLGLAAKKAAPRRKKPLPLLTHEYLQGIEAFSRRFFEDVYGRLRNGGDNPFAAIVFDSYEEVADDSPLHEILYEGMVTAPRGIKFIVISRQRPPEDFVRLRARGLMKTIGWEDLKFSLDESNRMVSRLGHKRVSSEALTKLHAKTGGWAAGIVLLLEGAKGCGLEYVPSGAPASRVIFQYFAREILQRADQQTRDFLLKTSLFARMSPAMAEALTGCRQALSILSDLTARNYFTQRLESEKAFYQYHPLFREFLQSLVAETLGPEEMKSFEKKAALILEENGCPGEAFDLLKRAQDWPDAVRIILGHAQDLTAQGRWQTIEGWIGSLPEAVVEEEPWLLYWAGVCRLPRSPADSRALFEKAFSLFRTRRDTVGIFLSISGMFDSTAYCLDSYKPYDETLALLDQALAEFPDYPSYEIEARVASRRLWAMFLRQPWRADFEKTVEQALLASQRTSQVSLKMQLLLGLVFCRLFSGEIQKAGLLFDSLEHTARKQGVPPMAQVFVKDAKSFHLWLRGEFDESRKTVEEALEVASTTGFHLGDGFLLGHATTAALNSGDMEAAEASIEKMAASLDQTSMWGREFYYHVWGWKLLLQGDLEESLSREQTALKFALEAGVLYTVALSHYGCALVLHRLGKEREAARHLAECYGIARRAASPILEFMSLLARAEFAFDAGDDPSGFSALEKAMRIGRDKGYVTMSFFWEPAMMAKLCHRALEGGIEVEYAAHLIRKRNLMPDPVPLDCERWPWALKIYTLGRFEIVRHGEVLRFPGKVQKKPLEMLKVLVAIGGGEVRAERIADCLWPDSGGDAALTAFATTLSRLRRLLGVEGAIVFQDGKASLDRRYCWVDALAFEEIFEQLDKADEAEETCAGEASKFEKLLEKAVGLYTGHFLPADEGEFLTISYRERLRSRFSRLIAGVGARFECSGLYEKAMKYYQKGLDIDDLSEEFYERLMICLQHLGRPAAAIEVYNRCTKLLSLRFGIEPSAKAKALYRKITGLSGD